MPMFLLVNPGQTSADSKYDIPSLTKLLLTGDELTAQLGPGLTDVIEIKPGTDPISVGRAYTSTDGDFININLFSPNDGSVLSASETSRVLDGDFIKKAAGGFSKVTDFQVLGPVLEKDLLASFTGTADGMPYNVAALSFVHGNIFGIIMYSTPGNNDATVLGAAYGAQLAKLP